MYARKIVKIDAAFPFIHYIYYQASNNLIEHVRKVAVYKISVPRTEKSQLSQNLSWFSLMIIILVMTGNFWLVIISVT